MWFSGGGVMACAIFGEFWCKYIRMYMYFDIEMLYDNLGEPHFRVSRLSFWFWWCVRLVGFSIIMMVNQRK